MLLLLITVDCLRHDFVNRSGHTPAIVGLCEKAHLFENAYATGGRTTYSFPAILGSHFRIGQPNNKFPVNKPSVAKVLKDNGFITIGVQAANPYLTSFFNYDVGFDKFEDFIPTSRESKEASLSEFSKRNKRRFIQTFIDYSKFIFLKESPKINAKKIVSFVIENLEYFNRDDNIFLWMHFMDTHSSFTPPREFLLSHPSNLKYWISIIRAKRAYSKKHIFKMNDLENIKELYLACVRYIDHNLERLFLWLKCQGWYDDAVIVLTSDHGESFMEHGYFEHPPDNLYNEQLQVPLIIKLPKQKQPKVHDKRVSHIDLFPSIFNCVGIRRPSEFCGKGHLFTPQKLNYPIFACGGTGNTPWKKIACIYKNWKLICEYKLDGMKPLELYNLKEDPNEKINQLEKRKSEAFKLLKFIENFYETFRTEEASEDNIEDKTIKSRLKALGYLD